MSRWFKSPTQLWRAAIRRPLRADELAVAMLLMLVLGTAYCATYCRIAFYPMHEGGMPLWLSAWWAGTGLVPWLIAFEVLKRLAPQAPGRTWQLACFALLAAATAAVTIAAQHFFDIDMIVMHKASWPTLLANQMLPVTLFALMAGLWATDRSVEAPIRADPGPGSQPLPSLASIQWIRSAGNYVEVKCGDRILIRRMTMRSAEEATSSADFIRIHRSVIVRKQVIAGFVGHGRSRIALTTGETMPVGDSYRRAVERLVPSSLGPSLHPIVL